jgi:hypothetical protein
MLDAINRGYFRSDGRHVTAFYNTYSGFGSSKRYNAFFAFDLDALAGTVDSAMLHLELEKYVSFNSSLTFDLFDVSATVAELDATYIQPSTAGVVIHNDLESGSIYATQSASSSDVGSILAIPLNVLAEAAIEGQLGDTFAVGLSVRGPDSSPDYELRFGDEQMLKTIQLELALTPPMLPAVPPVDTPAAPFLALPEPGGMVLWAGLHLCCLCFERRVRCRKPH